MLISIITINYNNKEGLEKTILSVCDQNFKDFEHVIIDGDSNDGSKDVIETYKDQFGFCVSEKDMGIYNAMNKGIKAAKGDYLLFLNSGDTLNDNDTLNNVEKYLDSKLDIYYGDLLLEYEKKKVVKEFPDKISFQYFFDKGYLPHPATFINKNLFDAFGLYNEDFKIAADWDFLIRVICKHNVTYQHLKFVISVFDKNGISSDPEFSYARQEEAEKILRKNFPLFIEDSKRLLQYDKKFSLNRFKILNALELNPRAQKLNSVWFSLMTKFFKIKS